MGKKRVFYNSGKKIERLRLCIFMSPVLVQFQIAPGISDTAAKKHIDFHKLEIGDIEKETMPFMVRAIIELTEIENMGFPSTHGFNSIEERIVLGDLITKGSKARSHLSLDRLKLRSIHC